MRRPQVIVFARDERLARSLDGLIAEKKWVLRESRQIEACIRQLSGSSPTVLVVSLHQEHEAAWTLLAQVAEVFPNIHVVAVGGLDGPATLRDIAWDLGVDFALFPPIPTTQLPGVVAGLMEAP